MKGEKNSNNEDRIDYELAVDLTKFTRGQFIISFPLEVENIRGKCCYTNMQPGQLQTVIQRREPKFP